MKRWRGKDFGLDLASPPGAWGRWAEVVIVEMRGLDSGRCFGCSTTGKYDSPTAKRRLIG